MPDTTPNNPENSPSNNSGQNENIDPQYEMLSAYIDNEIKDEAEKDRIKDLILSDNNYHNRYTFESLTKETFNSRIKRIETPVYVYKNIGQGIDDYIKKNSSSVNTPATESNIYSEQLSNQKSNLRRNLLYSACAFIFLVGAAFLFNSFLQKNPDLRENDLVAVSRNVFDKIEAGQVQPQYKSDNVKTLSDSMNKYLDFKVFIPDVKDAILIGGVCNEINGQKLAHIIHKRGNTLIYTLQASLKDVMSNKDRIILYDEFKDNIKDGKNWFPCTKIKNRTAVIWIKDNVICSTIAEMNCTDIKNILTNYK